ncbi:Peptide transporter family 1 [Frankliniella fusca]|uniref:Oligopeptide transporter 1 n=1 Tax=Frankliniella fusca TaxID=407009 RepID=A0AAE1HHR7_9NEOP|nr:Peptide transporter family 1 [Frankliniella fusca]
MDGEKKEKPALEMEKKGKDDPQDNPDLEKQPDVKALKYPKSVFFIIGNEFCERFSYYGMRTILSLFMIKALKLDEENATIIYHMFVMFCYFFPVFGAILADSFLGKFKTIAYLSVVYAIGNFVVATASATDLGLPSREMTYIGLLLIAVGTGGIKPCVSAFGGDQFVVPQQARQLASFFSVFYFSINAGSLISTWLTPELRTIACMGQATCFPLAFGVPAILMLVSLVIFIIGKPGYKIFKPQGNVLVDVSKCIGNAVTNRIKSADVKSHWLDHADERFSERLRSDIRAMLRVLLLFVPLPIFWALYDQQGSRWTFQANNMNGRIGSWTVKPDQMQVVNPLLILLLLPLFEGVVYPALNRARLLTRPLQKMATGGVLAAVAFIISAVLEIQLQAHYPVALSEGLAQARVFNGLPCDVQLAYANETFSVRRLESWTRTDIPAHSDAAVVLGISGTCLTAGQRLTLDVAEEKAMSFQLYSDDPVSQPLVGVQFNGVVDNIGKDAASPRVRQVVMYHFSDKLEHSVKFSIDGEPASTHNFTGTGVYSLTPALDPADSYAIALDGKEIVTNQLLDVGGVYTILVDNADADVLVDINPNVIHIVWMLPQLIVISIAEVMFSVTGLEFAFTQAPVSMKSVLTSAWLLTVAFGNLIVVLITEIRFFSSQANEFFLFAGLMLGVMVVFIWLAVRYTYVETQTEDGDGRGARAGSQQDSDPTATKTGKS